MAVVLIQDKVSPENVKKASKEYINYIKVVVDIESGRVTIGGMWHADGEKVLLENGSRQQNIWGGGITLPDKEVETLALINIKPHQNNNSQEILDPQIREKFIQIIKEKFSL